MKVRSRQLEQLVEAAIPLGLLNIRRGQHPRAISPREILPQAPEIGTIELSDFLLDLVSIQDRRQRHGCVIL